MWSVQETETLRLSAGGPGKPSLLFSSGRTKDLRLMQLLIAARSLKPRGCRVAVTHQMNRHDQWLHVELAH